ncbi:MAG: SprB repeat-containing protein [Bacteroidetes bacterium]|nr:SprB repeat-containing protein [Bacteroidota bacterium]
MGVHFNQLLYSTLYSGNYSILIQDANGCTDVINVTVSEPTAVLAPWNGQNSTCGFSNGSVTVTASGGTGTLMYSLNGGPFQLSNTFNNLPAGNYDITVQDANGCIVVAQTSVSNVPGPVIPNLTLTMVTCNGGNDGSVIINTIGGTLPFQYSINNGSTFQSGNTFNNLPAGNLVILVTDSNGCTVATNDVITEPSLIVSNEIITGSTCSNSNGSVTINAAGGTGALQYSLSGAPFQATGTYSGLSAGNYSFEVQDANHCIVTGNFVIPDAPGPIVTSTNFTEPLCNGGTDGSITITTNSGTNPLQFTYPGGPTNATGNFVSVAAGTYDITVTDANGCTATTQVTVTEPTPVAVNINITGSTCGYANGSIAAAGNGGSGVMQYNVDGGAFQASGNFNSMLAGNYTVIVQDANGCSLSTPVVIPDAPAPTISNIPIVNLICNGGTTGEISVITAGGTGHFHIPQWWFFSGKQYVHQSFCRCLYCCSY